MRFYDPFRQPSLEVFKLILDKTLLSNTNAPLAILVIVSLVLTFLIYKQLADIQVYFDSHISVSWIILNYNILKARVPMCLLLRVALLKGLDHY